MSPETEPGSAARPPRATPSGAATEATSATWSAPGACSVCGDDLVVDRLRCEHCGSVLTGRFTRCSFCSLGDADRQLLEVFLTSGGNLKEVERHLGVSYPTARARYNELLGKLRL